MSRYWKILPAMLALAGLAGAVSPSHFLQAQGQETVTGTEFGDPIQGISATEFELFRLGLDDFLEVEDAEEGLGPVFNGRSCAECHSVPRIGGSGTVMILRAGIIYPDGRFEDPPGGSSIQMFSVPSHEVQPLIPTEVNVIARRKALPLFGNGLIEAVPDEFFLALEDPNDADGDGISGRAHRVLDKESGDIRVGRFGWKAQQASLFTFGAEAYLNEMGITNDLFPEEVCPGGDCELIELVDTVPDPEDAPERSTGLRGIDNFANFLRLLGPPPRGEITEQVQRGKMLFESVQCASCHVPALRTGPHSVRALSVKRFEPYSDLLLHDIGTGDGIGQDQAEPGEIRTPPLWGLRVRTPFLHDGRAFTLRQAIEMHAGEAENSRKAFEALTESEIVDLLAFLRSL
ncbi:MAG: di-heme oxidoredictase family protein [Acidobacteriota bacterium]